jgi:hypothetical protein
MIIQKKIWVLLITVLPLSLGLLSGFSLKNGREGAELSILTSNNEEWIKIAVTEEGVYSIDEAFFRSAGINLRGINPRNIRMFGYPGGIIPQSPQSPWPQSLQELPILIEGEADGSFDAGDRILFYAESPHELSINHNSGEYGYQHNPYSDTLFYLLELGQTPGRRITNAPVESPGTPIQSFRDIVVYTNPTHNILFSGREWYSDRFDVNPNRNFDLPMTGIIPQSTLGLTVALMTQSFGPSDMQVNLAGNALGQIDLPPIPTGLYSLKGIEIARRFTLPASNIANLNTLRSNLNFRRFTGGGSNAFLHYMILDAERRLQVYNQSVIIRLPDTGRFSLHPSNTTNNTRLWSIQGAFDVQNVASSNGIFHVNNTLGQKYTLFDIDKTPSPRFAGRARKTSLKEASAPDMIIITTARLRAEAERLAAHRRNFNGYRVQVTTLEDIYLEYAAGRQDVTAIRNYLRDMYAKGRLKFALMLGRSSFDFKNRIPDNTLLVPTYQSRNSLHPILTFASDDYFGFLSGNKGEWAESSEGNYDLDIAIGRLPAKNPAEARAMIEKIIAYETSPETLGSWRSNVIFAADDGDANIHQRDADRLAQLVDTTKKDFQIAKVYLDQFPIIPSGGVGNIAPEATRTFMELIEEGALFVNYTGHGSERQLAAERLFDEDRLRQMRNRNRLPIFITATCEFGRNDHPQIISAAEQLLLNPNGGAIAVVSTTRPVFSSTNYQLNLAFYQHAFRRENGDFLSLGEVFRRTKNSSQNGVLNRNFVLLGDPAMRIGYGRHQIALNQISEQQGGAISEMSRVTVSGSIANESGSTISDFDGILTLSVIDAPVNRQTRGQDAPPFHYQTRDNFLFRGKASVRNGAFSIEFNAPKGIGEQIRNGSVFAYAHDEQFMSDASGVKPQLPLGGLSQLNPDRQGPNLRLFLNDTTFRSGGTTDPNPTMIAKLQDPQGILLANIPNTTRLLLRLDGTTEFELSRFFLSNKDDFSSGSIHFPLFDLSPGPHFIELFASDNHHNTANARLDFVVAANTKLQFRNVITYPNPVKDQVFFRFEHNKAGEPVEILLSIFSPAGQLIREMPLSYAFAPERITALEWNALNKDGAPLSPGVYIFRIRMISLRDGASGSYAGRLILTN